MLFSAVLVNIPNSKVCLKGNVPFIYSCAFTHIQSSIIPLFIHPVLYCRVMLAYILDRSKVAVRPKVIPPNYRDGFDRLAEKDGEVHCKEFYQMQSKHGLGDTKDVVKIPIWIWISHSNKDRLTQSDIPLKPVHRDWLPHLANAIRDINNAAPGLNLSETTDWKRQR